MGLLDKDVTEDIARGIRSVHDTVHEAARGGIGDAVAKGATRLRSGTKTRKSAATREKIMTAATELMVERGGTDFQMSEVSARCSMSKGALYYYFADKGALVQAIFDASVDDLVDEIEAAVAKAPSAMDSINRIAGVLARGMRPRSPLALAMSRELSNSDRSVLPSVETRLAKIVSIFSAQFDRAKEEGLVRPEVSSRLGAIAIAGAFTFAVLEQPEENDMSDSEEFSAQLVRLAFEGMGTPKAARKLGLSEPLGQAS